MEAAGLALSAAQTLLATLSYQPLQQMFTMWGCQSDLESLEGTVTLVRAVLLEAQSVDDERFLDDEHDLIEKLKDVVYDTDDLFDEFATLAKQKDQLCMEGNEKSLIKVRDLFFRFKKLKVAYSMSGKVQKIRKKLDQIVSDARLRLIKVDRQPIRKREETYAYVNENRIVGRDVDKENIVHMLLDPNILGTVPVVAIVGMGGLGKTALAQLIYKDSRIQTEFNNQRFWVCVSDQDKNRFNMTAILAKIYKLATGKSNIGDLDLAPLVQKLRDILDQNKYLLVLDDVWTEGRVVCNELMDILIGSGQVAKRGSRILVTTRSKRTATVIGCSHPYELQGLSDDSSWLLFKITSGIEGGDNHELVEMGKDIVQKCANIPLAIKVTGSFLYGQDKNTWKRIQHREMSAIRKEEDDIMPILKFSYYHLSPSLKSCFMYCAMFPKDSDLDKELIIGLWMAHNYVKGEGQGPQGIEEAAESCFNILAQRCFFQDIHEDDDGGIAFKIHDLMHDMAHQVVGKEIFIADSTTSNLGKNMRHLYDVAPGRRTKGFMAKSKIRSYLADVVDPFDSIRFPVSILLTNWRSLRVLDLSFLWIIDLPNAIGGLLHLRWLNLCGNRLKKLPESFTKLINLQTLFLLGCSELEELPEDFTKLINLRTLGVTDPQEGGLRYMPLGMEKMAYLTRLNWFILGQRKFSMKREVRVEDLRVPRNLRGSLELYIRRNFKFSKEYGVGGYLCKTEYLKSVTIKWPEGEYEEEKVGHDEVLLEDLQPNGHLKELEIRLYRGLRIPRWAKDNGLAASLPNLVKIDLDGCDGLKELPWLGKLQHLKTFTLHKLKNLEYIENKERGIHIGSSSDGTATAMAPSSSTAVEMTESSIFFPSLEKLQLFELPKLKGWWRGGRDGQIVSSDGNAQTASDEQLRLFPRLSLVDIERCPNLGSVPLGPAVDTLILWGSGIIEEEEDEKVVSSRSSNDCGNWRIDDTTIKDITTDNIRFLKSLPMVAFQCLTKIDILLDGKIESLSEVEEVFQSCSSSLRFLAIVGCLKLRSISRGLQHLTALESLELLRLPELRFDETRGQEEEEAEEEMPWKCLAQCLHALKLSHLDKVFNLPKGMRYLTALQSLEIDYLPLKDVPEWIGCLPSLKITGCKHVESLP